MLNATLGHEAIRQCMTQPVFLLARSGAAGLAQLPMHVRSALTYCDPAGAKKQSERAGGSHVPLLASGQSSHERGYRLENGGGVYAGWLWDGETLHLYADRYALHPMYYFYADGVMGVSHSLPALLAAGAPAELNMRGLSVFLRIGFFLGQHTPVLSIKALPEGGAVTWQPARNDAEPRIMATPLLISANDPQTGRPAADTDKGRKDYIDGYIDLFRQAVSRCVAVSGERIALPLSGGKDSRHIFLELCRQGRKPDCALTVLHYPPRANDDADRAAELASRAGIRHEVFAQPESRLTAWWCTRLITGFCTDEHDWAHVISTHLAGRYDTVFDGLAGDTLSESRFVTAERLGMLGRRQYDELALQLVNTPAVFSEQAMRVLLLPELMDFMPRELAVGDLSAAIRQCADDRHPIQRFFFANRMRREVSLLTFGVFGAQCQALTPYLDADLYDYLRMLPPEVLYPQGFHKEVIATGYPDYADIAYERKVAPSVSDVQHNISLFREVAAVGVFRKSHLMRNPSLWLRFARGGLDKRYAATTRWYVLMAAYLYQLEEFITACRKGTVRLSY
ncbi:asparagine synthase-related protein [Oleidesulfovibrio sp.]|uniref:asparagine synthase-related protein n=1 Tax=Oleidesulfovibrio sp. TaxID=2909707 RepID=UPI003A8AD868